MTEREKMLSGMLYDSLNCTELADDRLRCRKLCYEYNQLDPLDKEKQDELIRKILGKAKQNCNVHSPFNCDYGCNIEVGENFFSNYNLVILDCAKVTIGDNVLIAPNVGIYTAGHPLDVEQRSRLEYAYPVTIGSNVWIGGGVSILPGVTIGDNTVIGAGSVVTKDIPSNVLAYGNPCRVIREITEEDIMPEDEPFV